jgi:hypothetical protein
MLRAFPRREMLSALLFAVFRRWGSNDFAKKFDIKSRGDLFLSARGHLSCFLENKSVLNPCIILRELVFFWGLSLTG